jgi:limonene-1,2-epoxide hydrolase
VWQVHVEVADLPDHRGGRMSRNTDVVERLIAGWEARDVEAIMSCFTADAVYVNVPLEPVHRGAAAIREAVEGFLAMGEAIDFIVHQTAENPETDVVMNERTDRFLIRGRWAEAPVSGVFELRDGRICAWRDYFDAAEFERFQALLGSSRLQEPARHRALDPDGSGKLPGPGRHAGARPEADEPHLAGEAPPQCVHRRSVRGS